ncbi:MAG TPA: anaerobic glycerol-3-phosphate dehydrogenase subunit GlpB [Actinomycetes bacterium]|jgi:glycerol-3-phosphate dehydrogenase subunit B|nr:anaerobic glycerol-3-phosphate dehydrogenase subunit GlpB [Actinomycetes bacterium]
MRSDVVVVGAGPAGLAAAARLAEAGRGVRVIARGNGFTHWGPGAVDVLARVGGQVVDRPLDAVESLAPDHPYRLSGVDALRDGLDWFRRVAADAGLHHEGDAERNRRQVTALGSLRPTCLLPAPAARELAGKVAVCNFAGFRDFSAALCARGLERAGLSTRIGTVDLPAWNHERYFTAVELARAIDDDGFRAGVATGLARVAAGADVVVVPAVLGLARGHEPWADLERRVGLPVVEAAVAPPSIPGLRLFAAWRARLDGLGVRWQFGFPATGVERDGDRVTAVRSEGASRTIVTRCDEVVLATGGIAGHGIEANRDGTLAEVVAGLPVEGFPDRSAFVSPRFLDDHPMGVSGVRVDAELRPVHRSGSPVYANVRCIGSLLAGHDPTVEGSREGVALATATRAAALLAPDLEDARDR